MKRQFSSQLYICIITLILVLSSSCKPKKEDIKPQPTATFSYSGTTQAPATITFANSSTNASSYEWTFGDGASSTEQNPVHIYSTGGTYTISLKAKGDGGENATSQSITITNPVAAPIANFSILSGNNDYAPSSVSFLNSSSNATIYDWDFGDGTSHSSSFSPTHTYTSGGIYSVTLKASNTSGQQNIINKTVNILTPPTQVRVTNLQLNSMPFIDGSGAGWDPFDGPDVFFNIQNQAGTVLLDGSTASVSNLLQSQLPIAWTFTTPFVVSNLSDPRYFAFYDYDTADPNDYINYAGIRFSDWTNYPTTINVTQNGIQITLTVEWF